MGAGPEETGVCQGPFPDANSGTCYWNGVNDSAVPPITGAGELFPSIFQVLFQKNIPNTAAVYRYENITKIVESYVPQYLVSTDANVASQVSNLLKQSSPPAYVFAQFWDVQSAAVNSSYDGPSYLAAIAQVDSYIGQIYNSKSPLLFLHFLSLLLPLLPFPSILPSSPPFPFPLPSPLPPPPLPFPSILPSSSFPPPLPLYPPI